jgi:enoyl-CoA hydratase
MRDEGWRLLSSLVEIRQPVVAAVQGDAVGLGATLALMCDVVVTHPQCRFSDPHVVVGLVAGDGGCLAWPMSVGMARAKRHLLTGDAMTGDEAQASGLVTDVVDSSAEVLPAARALAERISKLPPLAVQGTKRALSSLVRLRFHEVMPISLGEELATFGSEDLREAVHAFKERREGQYRGR